MDVRDLSSALVLRSERGHRLKHRDTHTQSANHTHAYSYRNSDSERDSEPNSNCHSNSDQSYSNVDGDANSSADPQPNTWGLNSHTHTASTLSHSHQHRNASGHAAAESNHWLADSYSNKFTDPDAVGTADQTTYNRAYTSFGDAEFDPDPTEQCRR